MSTNISIEIPVQLRHAAKVFPQASNDAEVMSALIEISRDAISWQLGGPFAAAVVRSDTFELVGLGVNLVLNQQLSTLHAEMVAIMLAQRQLGTFDLATSPTPMTLYTTCEPCTMCLGASHWSGVRRVVCGAADSDAAAAGFDEGPKPDDWAAALRQRGIDVVEGLLRHEAAAVLAEYKLRGGEIYNSLNNQSER